MDQSYMQRCIELARLGAGKVAPNPMVGSVLVHGERIIGEGYHREYGQPHAEVNCIASVTENNKHLVSASTLYVSLEPCAHFGKTPPCSDLIIQKKIPKVVIGCRDPYKEVDGKGIDKLQKAGIETVTGVLEQECKALNKRFLCFVTKKRPYIILKWAQSANGKMAGDSKERLLISNKYTNRLVHQWRSEEAAILVGTNTALMDDPSLNNRLWTGNHPVRLVMDTSLRLPNTLNIFGQEQRTIVFNGIKQEADGNILYYQIDKEKSSIQQLLDACYQLKIQSVLVEGGAKLLQSFIDMNIWDEARVITNNQLQINNGLSAPQIKGAYVTSETISSDTIHYRTNKPTNQ